MQLALHKRQYSHQNFEIGGCRGGVQSTSLKSSPYLRKCRYCAIDCAIVTCGGEARFETLKCNAKMGTHGVKLVSVDRLQQLDVMPPKAKK